MPERRFGPNHCGIPVTTMANLENMTESGVILSELS
jgi:hypothetical protein